MLALEANRTVLAFSSCLRVDRARLGPQRRLAAATCMARDALRGRREQPDARAISQPALDLRTPIHREPPSCHAPLPVVVAHDGTGPNRLIGRLRPWSQSRKSTGPHQRKSRTSTLSAEVRMLSGPMPTTGPRASNPRGGCHHSLCSIEAPGAMLQCSMCCNSAHQGRIK
jgi:hypothetical protein